jgi:hypothetical protein
LALCVLISADSSYTVLYSVTFSTLARVITADLIIRQGKTTSNFLCK